jgi:hypothetical protein
MQPPDSAEVFETSTSKYWFEGDLLFVISKNGVQPDEETRKKQLEDFKKKIGSQKICAIMDVSNAAPTTKEQREYNTAILPELFKAIAFVIKNPMSRMLTHLYLGVRPLPFPVQMFSDENEAREWIKQYQ